MSSSAKKEAILRQFRQLTNATPQDAHRILKAHGYRIEPATDAFFNDEQAQINASAPSSTLDKKTEREVKERLNALFDRFRDAGAADDDDDEEESGPSQPEDPDVISIGGALRMCEALEVSPEDVVFLPLSFYLKSPSIGTFTRTDYVNGWKMLDLSDTIDKQKATLEKLRQELLENKPLRLERIAEEKSNPATAASANKGLYNKVYEYTYGFARREGQKSLALENALAFWDLVLPASPTFDRDGDGGGKFTQQQLNLWKQFLTEQTGGRAVSKDTWIQFLDFTTEINADFSNHDFDAAWPSVIDDFVLWARDNMPASDRMDTS
ncbi:related to DCN1-scaffold-type E3 ligase [Sporisorium scitamineum]|uniref:Defective in cullin neddylation protein n=3 Tax=Sporisorium scitamineum TaxID=49012 RepID=A0A140KN58_9BASI|nr:related to DCN1-scaffold-type E3 ligase [Sporisorium scitamineum]